MAAEAPDNETRLQQLADTVATLYADPRISKAYMLRFHELAAAVDCLPDNPPDTVQRVWQALHDAISIPARFYHVPSDYYNWTLYQRTACLVAPSVRHLCKSVIFENTRATVTDASDPLNSRYYCVITQYTAAVNSQKLLNFVRNLKQKSISKKYYNFRLADAAVSLALTGFENGGVSPIACTTPLPVIVSESILSLQPPVFYLGAGDVDWKLAMPIESFIRETGCFVTDLS